MQDCEKGRRSPRVLVVGAGFAAVGAARQLTRHGISDVTLLEARDRPGGRVQTIQLDDGFVELGGQFLHGQTDVYDFAQKEGLLRELEEEDDVPDTLVIYQSYTFRTPGGGALKPKVVRHNLQILEELQDQVNTAETADVSVSAADYMRTLYPEYMQRMKGEEHVKTAMIKWMEDWNVLDSSATVQDLSLPGFCRYVYEEGSGVQETKLGMWDVFQRLLKEALPPHRLLLNKAVKNVHWNGDCDDVSLTVGVNNNVEEDLSLRKFQVAVPSDPACPNTPEDPTRTVSEHQNSGHVPVDDKSSGVQDFSAKEPASETFLLDTPKWASSDFKAAVCCEDDDVLFADHVIVTSSMGFLKEHPGFFVPPLPSKQREAISSVGFGNVAKVFLLWELDHNTTKNASGKDKMKAESKWRRRMLGSDVDGVVLLWPEEGYPDVKSAKSPLRTSAGRQWYEAVSLIEYISSYGPCFVYWVGGEGATIMESLPESEVKDVLHELLVLFLGNPDLPPPSRLIRSEWYNNPYTRGAYSYLATGVPLELHDVLSLPLPSVQDPVVQCAGEACSTQHYGTVHGALYSGQHAADTILRRYNLLANE